MVTYSLLGPLFVDGRCVENFNFRAVLLNRDEAPATLAVSWDELGLPSGARVAVRDVIKGTDVGERTHGFSTVVAKHDVAFVRLRVVGRASASAL